MTTTTTLGTLVPGDEVLQIKDLPAARITVGVPWTDEPQRLVVRSAYTVAKTGAMILAFTNGGKYLPAHRDTSCVVAR